MKYTKYIMTLTTLSLLSVATIASAATGTTATMTATGTTATTAATASLEVKGAPRLVKKTTDSVTLEWDKVTGASAYIVKYSKVSVANSKDPNAQYDNETDQVTATGITVSKLSIVNEKLTPATAYYFSVVAIDKEGKESDTFSDELMVMTDSAATTTMAATSTGTTPVTTAAPSASLAIKDLTVVSDNNLTLTFTSQLSAAPVKVKITKTSDNSDIVVGNAVQDTKNPSTVIIETIGKLSPATSYTLTVLAAKDMAGNTIQEGVSGLKEFTTSTGLKTSAVATLDPTLTASGVTGTGVSLNAATTATKVETGAKENIIILAALLLSLGIAYVYRRKLI